MIEDTNTKHKWLANALYLALGLISIAVLTAVYWIVSPMDIITVKNNPVPVRPPVVAIGNAEILNIYFCKLTDNPGSLRISFVGETTETFLPIAADNSKKACARTDLPILIPQGLEPGKYHIHFKATYQANPLKTIVEQWDSQEFNVQ